MDGHRLTEVGLSNCQHGCKVYRCSCGLYVLLHSRSYGCKKG